MALVGPKSRNFLTIFDIFRMIFSKTSWFFSVFQQKLTGQNVNLGKDAKNIKYKIDSDKLRKAEERNQKSEVRNQKTKDRRIN
jgi:predicted transglutaminase-like protease